ncbi:MAG: redoxin domain-containing protein [Bacteroidales bacterium]|nr:redoxin domain-containing protein [Bacteroidales bacterium]
MKKKAVLLSMFIFCASLAHTQDNYPVLGEKSPSFVAETTQGELQFPDDYGDSWKILFSHPEDFTQVCTSEIIELAKMQDEFNSLNIKIAILSADDLHTHKAWVSSMNEILISLGETDTINFPLIDDHNLRIAKKYGMIHFWENPRRTVRGVFVIDPDNHIRTISFYPMNLGRNMEEIKRSVVALQTSDKDDVLMPANWNAGDDVLLKVLPYLESELLDNPELADQYYKISFNMWYRKGLSNK